MVRVLYKRFYRILFILAAAALFLGGCSPTSLNTRYKNTSYSKPEAPPKDEKSIIIYSDLPEIEKEDTFIDKFESLKDEGVPFDKTTELMITIIDYLKTPYLYGGNTKSGIDCSGFTCNIYNTVYDKKLPRTANQQYEYGEYITQNELKPGDLVFFRFDARYGADHVGIYIGNSLFAHSSSKYGVTIASLARDFYIEKFVGARRIN